MGKLEPRRLFVATDRASIPATGETVFCPCLEGLPPDIACRLGILPIHDANGRLLDQLSRGGFSRIPDFAGVCLADPFRRLDEILDCVRAAGIRGIVNLPTLAPLLDQESNQTIVALHDVERQALSHARERDFEYVFITTKSRVEATGGITLDSVILPERISNRVKHPRI